MINYLKGFNDVYVIYITVNTAIHDYVKAYDTNLIVNPSVPKNSVDISTINGKKWTPTTASIYIFSN